MEVEVYNQYGQVTGTALDTVVMRTIAWNAPNRLVSGIASGDYYFRYTVEDDCGNSTTMYCPFEVRRDRPTAICNDGAPPSLLVARV